MAEQNRTPHTRTASYLAEPGEVHRVLLLYSGGLDTSVMLKWIQDEYEAEVVALTVNLGQPGEDYDVVQGKALQLGAVAAEVVDAREEFARDFVVPAIKANAVYGLGYPLFTALGRPLIAKLAVEYARKHGCDTIAHGCTGKGNDQVRIEATVATLAPELKVIAPVRGWQMGREEEIAYAREHGIPIKGGAEHTPYSIDDNLWGRSSEGRWIEELDHAPDDDVFQLVTRPELAPDEPEVVTVGFERGVPVALERRAPGDRRAARARRRDRLPPRRRHRRPHRGPHRRPEGARHLRGPGGGHHPARPTPSSSAWSAPSTRTSSRASSTASGPTSSTRGCGGSRCAATSTPTWRPVNAQVTGTIGMKLFKGMARVVTRESPNAVYDAALSTFETSGGLFSQQASPGFIELWSLQSRMAHRLRTRDEG